MRRRKTTRVHVMQMMMLCFLILQFQWIERYEMYPPYKSFAILQHFGTPNYKVVGFQHQWKSHLALFLLACKL